MIVGIGTDLVAVVRVKAMLDRHDARFTDKHFSADERVYCDLGRGGAREQRYAARFAAKEACAKALGCGIGPNATFSEIEVTRRLDAHGRREGPPALRLHGTAKATADRLGVTAMHLSLAHERDHAMATVILERPDQPA